VESVIKMMYLLLATGSPSYSIEDHLKYGDYVERISSQFLERKSSMEGELPESSYEAGVVLALQSSGIASQVMLSIRISGILLALFCYNIF
jgi:hypothetical protein